MDITKELQTIEPGITRIQVENIIRKIKKRIERNPDGWKFA